MHCAENEKLHHAWSLLALLIGLYSHRATIRSFWIGCIRRQACCVLTWSKYKQAAYLMAILRAPLDEMHLSYVVGNEPVWRQSCGPHEHLPHLEECRANSRLLQGSEVGIN